MNELDNSFFDAYKHLDKICGEKFNCKNGVSEYISEMERNYRGRYRVSSWESDYKSLKHIRWIRNQIAHDTSEYAHSNEADLCYAKDFYDRIMNICDPLAELRKAEERSARKAEDRRGRETKEDKCCNSDNLKDKPSEVIYHNSRRQKEKSSFLPICAGIVLLVFLFTYLLLR